MPNKDEQIQALVYLLRDLEWSAMDTIHGWMKEAGRAYCPSCFYPKPTGDGNAGHSWQCQLAQALDFYEDMP